MPRFDYQYNNFAINNLLDLVKKQASFEIKSMKDCERLSELMSEKGPFISKDTLGRLYCVIKTKSMPSKYTLDILTAYIGYDSWETYFNNISDNINS